MAGFAACISAAYAFQREFREFPGEDQLPPVTPDQLTPSEFVWGRLMYPSGGGAAVSLEASAGTGATAAATGPTTIRPATGT